MAGWSEPTDGVLNVVKPAQRDPKPPARVKASFAEWQALRRAYEYATCVNCGLAYQHLHHIVFRSEGGGDIAENLAPMCLSCHERFHSRGAGWERVAAAIRQYVIVDNARRRYVEQKLGVRFNKRYPALANTDAQFQSDFDAIYGIDR